VLAGVVALSACALGGATKPHLPSPAAPLTIGVELPLHGDIGADGLRALDAIGDEITRYNSRPNVRRLRIVIKDTTLGGLANPHQDEGVDASGLPPQAASLVREFGKDANVLAALGGLQAPLAAADAKAASALQLPLVTLAPLPDDCGALGGRAKTRFAGAFSVAGAASLEALAVARLVKNRGYHTLGILSQPGVKPRAEQARCLIAALTRPAGAGQTRIVPSTLRSDFATLERRAAEGELDGFVYFGPAERGALLCDRLGILGMRATSLAVAAHRGYDSATIPARCRWLRRVEDAARAAQSSVESVIQALAIASRRHNGDAARVTRREMLAALRDVPARGVSAGSAMLACAGGSADRATFESLPPRRPLPNSFSVADQRCVR